MARGLSMPGAVARAGLAPGHWVTLPARRARTTQGEAHSPVAERPLFLSAAPRLATLARAHESRIQENVHEVGRHRHAVSENVVRSVVVHPSPLVASRVVGERQLGTMTAVDRVVLLVTALPNALGGGLVDAIVILMLSAAGGRVRRENLDRERLSYLELRGGRRRRGERARRDRRGGRRSERDPPAPGWAVNRAAVSCRRRSG